MNEPTSISLVSGGFDPLHSGHVNYIEDALQYGEIVILLNSDEWLTQKKGRPFMPWEERARVMGSLKGVTEVIAFNDMKGDATDGIQKAVNKYPYPEYRVSFLNGGDRTLSSTPEVEWCQALSINCIFGVGGDKTQSSSWILKDWETQPTKRIWGQWRVLKDYPPHHKVKELLVYPGRQLSYQKHFHRSEYWHVVQGEATLYGDHAPLTFGAGKGHHIAVQEWHQLANLGKEPLKIIELQWGDYCEEDDIERQED